MRIDEVPLGAAGGQRTDSDELAGMARPAAVSSKGRATPGILGAVAIAALGVCVMLPHVGRSFFYADDYLNFGQARQMGLTWNYLVEPILQHFAPGHRFLDWAQFTLGGLSWSTAMAIMMAFYVGSVLAFWWLCVQLFGSSRWVLAITFLFAMSVAFVRTIQWWAAAAHSVPALCFGLLALALAVRHIETRRLGLALAAALAYVAGLLFYTKGLFVFGYLVLIIVLFLQRDLRPAPLTRRLWHERWLLVAFAVPTLAYLAYYRSGPYGEGSVLPSALPIEQYLRILWLRGFGPTLVGQRVSADTDLHQEVAVVVAQVIVASVVVGSLLLKRSAWRAWTFFGISAAVNVLVVGLARVEQFGPSIAYDARYWIELPPLFFLSVGFALSSGVVAGAERDAETASRTRQVRRWLPTSGRAQAVAVAILVVAYLASFTVGADRIADEWPAGKARSYVNNVERSLNASGKGRPTSPLGGLAPFDVVAGAASPSNELTWVLPLIDEHIVVNDARRRLVVLGEDGVAQPARWHRAAGGATRARIASAVVSEPLLAATEADGGAACIPALLDTRLIELMPPRPLAVPGTPTLRIAPAVGTAPITLGVLVDGGHGWPGIPGRQIELRADGAMTLTDLGAQTAHKVALEIPAGLRLCLERLEIGVYRPR